MSELNFTPATGTPGALYCRYSGQTNPQGVYIELDGDDVTIDYNGEIGNAVPSTVWHGTVRRYWFPGVPTVDTANWAAEEMLPLLQRVADGLSIVWDGNNHVGKLTADAAKAEEEIDEALNNWGGEYVEGYSAWDWLEDAGDLGVTADSTDEELGKIADDLELEAEHYDDGVVILEGTLDYLRELRQRLRDKRDEEGE